MKQQRSKMIAWALCATVAVSCVIDLTRGIRGPAPLSVASDLMWNFVWLEFAILAALIVSKQPDNRVGWLLMAPLLIVIPDALLNTARLQTPTPTPPAPSPLLLLTLWFDGWSWVPPIFSLLLLPVFFPTGRPHSPRWRLFAIYTLAVAALFIAASGFVTELQSVSGDPSWTVRNPIGFIPVEAFSSPAFNILWSGNLAALALLSLVALVQRYRRAGSRERRQVKVLLYACAVFAVIYVIWLPLMDAGNSAAGDAWGLVFLVGAAAIPLAIAYSILRYQLFDIDLVIRRTLVYAVVTALLGLVFYGSIILLQRLFTGATGEQSPVALVASTLVIAALFSPLRQRVQDVVDRRFYRRKYDAARVLSEFGAVARNETDLNRIEVSLATAVEETLQPQSVGVWLK